MTRLESMTWGPGLFRGIVLSQGSSPRVCRQRGLLGKVLGSNRARVRGNSGLKALCSLEARQASGKCTVEDEGLLLHSISMEPMQHDKEVMKPHWSAEKKSRNEWWRVAVLSLQTQLMLLEPTMGHIKKPHMHSVCVIYRLRHYTSSEKSHLH